MTENRKVAFAIGAHPDDIEFMMGGTLILLQKVGYKLHCMTIGNGSCGTATLSRKEIIKIREKESRNAAKFLDAEFHKSLVDDIDIFYEKELLAKVGALVRDIKPTIMLVPAPDDYMEDHTNTSRLAVSAAFCRGMRNFQTKPERSPIEGDVAVYHALPYGLKDNFGHKVYAGQYVDISSIMDLKRELLSMHQSQKEWLDVSQGLNSYLNTMQEMSEEVGNLSKCFKYAEGWRYHNHLGFSDKPNNPLSEALGKNISIVL